MLRQAPHDNVRVTNEFLGSKIPLDQLPIKMHESAQMLKKEFSFIICLTNNFSNKAKKRIGEKSGPPCPTPATV